MNQIAKKTYFTPGPSELYFTVPDHLQHAMKTGIASMSHRGKLFQAIFEHATSQIRTLLNVPETHHIVFLSSANEAWERILQNLTTTQTFHFINGSFSKKFYEFAKDLGRDAHKLKVPMGKGFPDISEVDIPESVELITIAHNETSAGVSIPVSYFEEIKRRYPDTLLAVDAVSSVPVPQFDFSVIDTLYFSVQKGMGLPAGLGVWIFNDKCIEVHNKLRQAGAITGTYHSLNALLDNATSYETPETPNVLGIYLLGKVCEDMNRKGIETIRRETSFKANILYNFLDEQQAISAFIEDKRYRSQTVIVIDINNGDTAQDLISVLSANGIEVGKGYGSFKDRQIRIANFPTHSTELCFKIVDVLSAYLANR